MSLSTTQYGYIIDPLVPLTDDTGRTIRNGYIRVFMVGTSTSVITYKNFDGATNEETVQLDNSGRTAYPVIGSKGSTYKVCVYDAEHSQETPILTVDKVVPIGASVNATNVITGLDTVVATGQATATVAGTTVTIDVPRIKDLANTATEADLASGNYFALDGSEGTKKLPGDCIALKSVQDKHDANFAPDFDPNRTQDTRYLVGQCVMYQGSLYVFKNEHYGAWNSSDVTKVSIDDAFARLEDAVSARCFSPSYFDTMILGGINTSGGIGSTVTLTPTTGVGYRCIALDCKKGDVFRINGNGFAAYRLWCFVDSSNKIVAVAPSSYSTGGKFIYVVAPIDGKFICNINSTGTPSLQKGVNVYDKFDSEDASNIENLYTFSEELRMYFVDGYVNTSGGYGSVVSYTPTSGGGQICAVFSCKKGDVFKIKGVGAYYGRLYCFVDSSNKIVECTAVNATTNGAYIYKKAPVDGKVIINFSSTVASNEVYRSNVASNVLDYTERFENNVFELSSVYSESLLSSANFHKSIRTDGGIGSTVSYTEVATNGCVYSIQPCVKGDVFKIRGGGYTQYRRWCFVDSSDKIVAYSYNSATNTNRDSFVYLVAPTDGKIIVNLTIDSSRYFAKRVSVQDHSENVNGRLDFIEREYPMVNIALDRAKFSPADLLDGFDFSSSNTHIASDIYALFDALVTSSSGLMTSFDVAEFCDESYPAYVGDDVLKCYKISKNAVAYGNEGKFVKRKMLITGGVHGNERAAPFNLYIFAWRLINDVGHDDLFGMLSAYDIYIMPCVNLYGLANNKRWNGNGVDINRNSGTTTIPWRVDGEPYTSTYSGPIANSEFETRCIHKCIEELGIDFYIDHHNYAGNHNFYSETNDERILMKSYDAFKEVSLFAIKNLSSYFGTKFMMVRNNPYASACPQGLSSTWGELQLWAHEYGILSCVIEINEGISWNNGEHLPEGEVVVDDFGPDAFTIGEFTLRCQLALYGQLLMPQVY